MTFLSAHPRPDQLSIGTHGAEHFHAAINQAALDAVCDALSGQPSANAGIRLFGIGRLRPMLEAGGPFGALRFAYL